MRTRLTFRCILFAILAAVSAIGTAAFSAQPSPNIIIIVADDLGYGDVGCYGSREAQTPNLDRLASQGVRLTDFYVTHPSCTPTRAGLMTGRYPQRYGTTGALTISSHPAFNRAKRWTGGLPRTETVLPELLKQRGYATGCFGKWHLGYGPGQRPQERGFDHSLVCSSGHVDSFTGLFFGLQDIFRDGQPIEFAGYTTDVFTDAAIEFVDQNKDKPFFVYLPYNAVHYSAPTNHPAGETKHGETKKLIVQAKAETLSRFAQYPEQRQHYLAALADMDAAIGRLMEALDKTRLAENTLVIFFSDNGGDLQYGATNTPLRGEKAQVWEGGIRVPAIVRWPGKFPAGRECREPLSQMDYFNLSLAVASATVPIDRPIDGRNPLATLTDDAPSPHEALYFTVGRNWAVRAGSLKLIQAGKDGAQLFDMHRNRKESPELVEQNPAEQRRLDSLFQAWRNNTEGHAELKETQ